jgi:alkylation response protein AidB-like acyl-CoA dehydrogenase
MGAVSHFRSNLQDLFFNLFDVHQIHTYSEDLAGLDRDTMVDILREVERLAGDEWAASFVDADRNPPVLVEGEVKLPDSLKASIGALQQGGWDLLGIPEELGGTEVPPTLFWAVQELLLGANPTAAFYVTGPLFARVIWEEGTPEQRRFAHEMVARRWAGTMVLTEPDAGSDVGAATTRAVHVEGDTWHLEGVKRFITGGDHDAAENIVHLVLARPVGAGPGTKGLSMFIVPKYLVREDGTLGERNGVAVTHLESKMGLKGSATCELTFGVDRPCVGYLVGGVHDGIRQMFRIIQHARMTIGTKSASTLSTGYLNALAYAKERIQGPDLTRAADKTAPRVPIIRHPDVRRMLMIQKSMAEALRALWTYTAWVQDQTLLEGPDSPWSSRFGLLLPVVKGYSSERAYETLALSLQVLGGSGYIQDYPIEQYIRDAKIDTVYEGTTGIQALDLFFRKIVKDQGQAVAALASEVAEFVKGGDGGDPLAAERELLGAMLEDAQAQLGAMVGYLTAGDVYRVGLHATPFLFSFGEVVCAWQLLRHAEIAARRVDEDPFYRGKVAAARFFVRQVAPLVAARRSAAEAEDGSLMELPAEAF